MERDAFRKMVMIGDITSGQAIVLVSVLTRFLNREVLSGGIPDITPIVRGKPSVGSRDPLLIKANLLYVFQRSGGLAFFSRARGHYQVVIHWPSFFLRGFQHPKSPQAWFVWLFQSIIRRRSPLLFSLLRRKLLTELSSFKSTEDEPNRTFSDPELKSVVPVSIDEVVLFEIIAQKFVSMPELGYLMRNALQGMFRSSGANTRVSYHSLGIWKKLLPANSSLLWETTLVSLRRINELNQILIAGGRISIPDAHTDSVYFGAPNWGGTMFDVLSIPHFSLPDGQYGVYSTKLTDDQIPYIVFNVPVLIRNLAKEDKYSDASKVFWARAGGSRVDEKVRDAVCLRWATNHPLIMENRSRHLVDSSAIWPEAKTADIYVAPVSAFQHYRIQSRKMGSLRTYIPPEKRGAKRIRPPGFKKIVEIHSPSISEADGASFAFRVTHRARAIYISPGWELSFSPNVLEKRNYNEHEGVPVLKSGIVRNELTGEYYYSLGRYLSFGETPVAKYSQLESWLRTFLEGMTREEFDFMRKSVKRNPTPDISIPRAPHKKAFRIEQVFTPEMDRIIKRHLRPGTMAKVQQMIEELDAKITSHDITRRAAILRETMIEEGTLQTSELPHVNYSARLGRRLKALRDRKMQRENASTKNDTHRNEMAAGA